MTTLFDPPIVEPPTWVLNSLLRAGLPPRRGHHVITTHRRQRATPRWCPCGQPIWTGLADREDVTLDPTPTTINGELFAIITNRRTYQMDYHGIINRRWPEHIRYDTADAVRVYLSHVCNEPHAIPNPIWEPVLAFEFDAPPF